MNPRDAAWIRATVWRPYHRATDAELPSFYSRCACSGSSCGHCTAGRHQQCTHERHHPHESCAAYLTCARGYVLAQVWEAGHRHTWTCTCKSTNHGGRPQQISLF